MSRQWAQKKSGSNSLMSVQKSSSWQRPFTDPVYDAPAPKQTPSVQAKRRNVDWSRVTVEAQSPAGVQAKLSVGAPGDKYEQEADAMANKVMTMPAPEKEEAMQREVAPEENKEEEVQAKSLAASVTPLVQREMAPEENKEEEVQAKSLAGSIQREMAPEENKEEEVQPKLATDTLQREVMPEEEEVQTKSLTETIQREAMPEEEEQVQTKALDSTLQRETMPEEEEPVQTKQTPNPSLENQLNSSQGSGSPLPDDVRTFMEPRFGADFSQVRVHTGSDAVQMNRDLNAQAFTHKQDVYFGAGKAPGKDTLTAHELTHVIQQVSPKSATAQSSIRGSQTDTSMINRQEVKTESSTVVENDEEKETGETKLIKQQVSVEVTPTTKSKLLGQFSTEVSFNVSPFGLSPIEFSPTFKMKLESIGSKFRLSELAFKVKAKTEVDLVSPLSVPKFGLFVGAEGEYPLFNSKAAIFGSVGANLKPSESKIKFSPDASLGLKFFFP